MLLFLSLISFFISFSALAYASYTDLKERIVPDFLSYGLILTGLIIGILESFILNDWIYFIYAAFAAIYGFIFALILYKMGLWAGGDVKLLTGISALNPVNLNIAQQFGLSIVAFSTLNLPIFPITFFIFSIFSMLPYGAFLVFSRINKMGFIKSGILKSKGLISYAIFLSAIAQISALLNLDVVTALIAVIIFGFIEKKMKIIAGIMAVLLFLISINYAQDALKSIFDSFAIFLSLFALTQLIYLLSLSGKVLRKRISANELEEGMIPAENILIENNQLRFEEPLSIKRIINYLKHNQLDELKKKIEGKEIFASANKACGFTQEQVNEIKKIVGKETIIGIKESAPMVPAMLIAYLLLNIVGDLLWNIIIR
ncbi:MAG: prepilin peptidase [archaeon]